MLLNDNDRRKIPLSVIFYRITILLTVVFSAVVNYQLRKTVPDAVDANRTLEQGLKVPAIPVSGSSPLKGTDSCCLIAPIDAVWECVPYSFGYEHIARDRTPPVGGGL